MKIIILSPLVIVDSIWLTNLNLNQDYLPFPFVTILEHPLSSITTKLLVIFVEVIVISFKTLSQISKSRSHSSSNSRSKYSHNQSFYNHSPVMVVIDLVMINSIENLIHVLIIHIANTTIQHPLVPHINLLLVLANAPQVTTTPLLTR